MQITNNGFLVTMTIIIIMALPVLIIRNSMKKTQEEIKKTHAVENKNIAGVIQFTGPTLTPSCPAECPVATGETTLNYHTILSFSSC